MKEKEWQTYKIVLGSEFYAEKFAWLLKRSFHIKAYVIMNDKTLGMTSNIIENDSKNSEWNYTKSIMLNTRNHTLILMEKLYFKDCVSLLSEVHSMSVSMTEIAIKA